MKLIVLFTATLSLGVPGVRELPAEALGGGASWALSACSNYCTTDQFGLSHRTASFGVGISDASTHGWVEGSCGGHHIIGCNDVRLPGKLIERLERAALHEGMSGVEAVLSTADGLPWIQGDEGGASVNS